ncbi:tetratricopeptide repeat protein [Dechloromonas sp. XY25]|uniref:Tetratricopeptide repeat protein n=1 Tax=Dechloromonas hankyongensis TaxID=2908002 RepID=A0ABS9K2Z9_9RHOO|nr:tetratricopeptide repeat protein [Dechloromonas hankyongensis]MCG2577533.1 tetratricopeptide repeat protein [Dechloromonas hankyongensis]
MYPLKHLSSVLVVGAVITLSGCASKNTPMSQEEFSTAMAQSSASADSLLEKGNREEAVKVLNDLAKKNPGRKDPWVRMARIHFDGENYAQAIVAAEEALQRDNTDRTAKSIRAVGGLRVAAQSLNDLKGDVELKGDARSDAVGLAKVMRDTLGEDVLVPPDDKKKKPAPIVVRPKPAATAPSAQPVGQKPLAPVSASAGNPFGALK